MGGSFQVHQWKESDFRRLSKAIGAHIPKDAEKELEAVAMNYSADRRITIPRKSTAIRHLQKLRQSLPKFKASVAEIDELAVQTMARSNPNPSHIDWLYDTVSASRNPGCFSSHWSVLIGICRRSRVPGFVVALPRFLYVLLTG